MTHNRERSDEGESRPLHPDKIRLPHRPLLDISEESWVDPAPPDFRAHRIPGAVLDVVGTVAQILVLLFVVIVGCGLHIAFLRAVTAP